MSARRRTGSDRDGDTDARARFLRARANRGGPLYSDATLEVLRAIRLSGVGSFESTAARTGQEKAQASVYIMLLATSEYITSLKFDQADGWVLTADGYDFEREQVQEQVARVGAAPALTAALERFEQINGWVVGAISQWQLTTLSGSPEHLWDPEPAIADLAVAEPVLPDLLAPVIALLPRFGRYPTQFSAALDRARRGETEWIAGIGRLSCHTVWAELHEDLLSSLGRHRNEDSVTPQESV